MVHIRRRAYLWTSPATATVDVEQRPLRVTKTPGQSIGAYLAWNRDRIGLAWCDNTLGQQEIYFQEFDARGRARTPASRLTHNTMESVIPAIAPIGNGFLLAWNEFTPGPGGGHDPRGRSEVQAAFSKP